MSDLHDHEPDAFDSELIGTEVHLDDGNPQIEVTFSVPVAASTLTALTERAHREGRSVDSLVADALRAAA